MSWIATATSMLWTNVWIVLVLALAATLAGAIFRCRPGTRHALWVVVLAWFFVPPLLPRESLVSNNQAPSASMPLPARLAPDGRTTRTRASVDTLRREPIGSEPATIVCFAPLTHWPVFGKPAQRETLITPPSHRGGPYAARSPAPERVSRLAPRSAQPAAIPHATVPQAESTDLVTNAPIPRDRAALRAGKPAASPDFKPVTKRPGDRIRADAATWQPWVSAGRETRDLILNLPPLPANIWLGGAALLLAWTLLRVAVARRLLRRSRPAPAWAIRETRSIARRLRIRRIPEVRMVEAAVSPMIWCGLRPQLVLPSRLWGELDRTGRKAILCHELAHLRRLDHWVRWLELAVSTIWWWHPVTWWARRRIHEEADASCDAWVTWLMPRGRRAYAEALLKTREFVSDRTNAHSSMGMAVGTRNGRRLARRLTMVMTQTIRPRPSVTGFSLAGLLLVAGWLVAPALACPPKAKEDAKAPKADCRESCDKPCDKPCDKAGDEQGHQRAPLLRAPAPVLPPTTPAAPRTPRAVLTGGPRGFDGFVQSKSVAPRTEEKVVIHKYALPKGKLKSLTNLMIRNDVPIRVRPCGDALEVHAKPSEHVRFAAFVKLIHPEAEFPKLAPRHEHVHVPHALHAGSGHAAVSELAPLAEHVRKLKHDAQAGGQNSGAEIRRLQALINKLSAELSATQAQHLHQGEALARQAEALYEQAERLREQAEEVRAQAEELRVEANEHELENGQRRAVERQVRAMERQARQVERQANRLERKAGKVEQQGAELDGGATELDARLEALEDELQMMLDELHELEALRSEPAGAPPAVGVGRAQTAPAYTSAASLFGQGSAHAWTARIEPAVAEALEEAADALRAEAIPEMRGSFAEAARALRSEWREQLDDLHKKAAQTGQDAVTPLTIEITEQVAQQLELLAKTAIDSSLERVAQTLEQKAQELRKERSAPSHSGKSKRHE